MQNNRHVNHFLIQIFFWNIFFVTAQNPTTIDSFNYYYGREDYSKALEFWEIFDEDCNDFELVKNAGNCYKSLSRPYFALEHYFKALSLLDNTNKLGKYKIYYNLSMTYRVLTYFDKADFYLDQASNLLNNTNKKDSLHSPTLWANIFLGKGKIYRDKKLPDSAEIWLLKSVNKFINAYGHESDSLLIPYVVMLNFYLDDSQYAKAINYGKNGLVIAKDGPLKFTFAYNLGIAYYSMKNWSQSIFYFNKALSHITDNNIYYKPYIESALAYCYSKSGSHSFDSLFSINNTQNGKVDTVAYAYHLMCYGKHLKNRQINQNQSLEYYSKAFQLLKNKFGVYHERLKDIYYILGFEAQNQMLFDSSLFYLQRALYCVTQLVDTADYSSNPYPYNNANKWLMDVINHKLRVLGKIAQGPHSVDSIFTINHLILANSHDYISILESLLRNKTFMADKLFVLRDKIRKRMLTAVDACYDLYNQTGREYYFEKGLEFSEAGKYLLLKTMMNEKAEKQQLPDDLAQADLKLQNEINRIHMLQNSTPGKLDNGNKYRKDSLDMQLFSLILQKDSLRNVILSNYPMVHQYETHHISLSEIRNQLKPGQALVEYFLQDTVLHAFYIGADGLYWKRVDNTREILSAVENTVLFCNLSVYGKITRSQYIYDAAMLNDVLLSPLDDFHQVTTELLIIPDVELNYLPFDILLTEMVNENTDYREMPYVLRDHTISYYHSIRFLLNKQMEQSRNITEILAFVPEFTNDTTQASNDNLSKSVNEAGYLMEFSDCELLAGNEATKENLFIHAPGKDIIHFASHATADTENAFDSYILLTPDPVTKEPQKLYASEISCMNLDAQMAVLNSCNSGSGHIQAGEGVISLAWAFNYAGCESVVLSPNPLDDLSAQKIITSFYSYLKSGISKSEALRQAKLDFLAEIGPSKTHPAFWGSLIVTGNQQPLIIESASKGNIILYSVVVVAGILLILFALSRRLFERNREVQDKERELEKGK